MFSKKLYLGIAALLVAACIGFTVWHSYHTRVTTSSVTLAPQETFPKNIKLIIDNGTTKTTYDAVSAQTVFDALMNVSRAHSISVVKKDYSFGVFIEQIGNLANTKDKTWIYYVNGASGDVAADKKTLKNGDVVEWRYTKPIY